MPHPIPSLSPKEAAAVAAQLANPASLSEPAPERHEATDIVAEAYNAAMSDPVIRTSHDAARYILDALEAAGHRPFCRKPTSFDFSGQHELDWSEVEMEIHRLATKAEAVEFLGRQAIDRIHSQKMGDVFDQLSADMLEHVARLQALLGLKTEMPL